MNVGGVAQCGVETVFRGRDGDVDTDQLFPMVPISRLRRSRCSSVKELMKPFKLNGMEFNVRVFDTTAVDGPSTLGFFEDEPLNMSISVRCLFSGFEAAFPWAGTLSGAKALAGVAFDSVSSILGLVVDLSGFAGRPMRSS